MKIVVLSKKADVMNKVITFLAIAVLSALLLAACTTDSSQPGEPEPGVTETMPGVGEGLPGLGDPMTTPTEEGMGYPEPAETATGEVSTTETPPSEAVTTEPAEAATEPVEAATEATTGVTETEVIPPTGPMDPGRITNLLGYPVMSQNGEQIGQVDDFIVDISSGAITYVVVNVSDTEGAEQILVPVPFTFLKWDATTGTLTLTTDQQTVLSAPAFEGGEYPDTQVADWDVEFRSYWETISPGE